jgi:hypothetical protein
MCLDFLAVSQSSEIPGAHPRHTTTWPPVVVITRQPDTSEFTWTRLLDEREYALDQRESESDH